MNHTNETIKADVIIVGGGIIGASIAFHLQQAGKQCIILERGQIGCQASKAGAGMLGAQVEMSSPGPLFDLGIKSRSMYPELAQSIREISGIDIEYQEQGILRIATSEDEIQVLQDRRKWQLEAGQSAEWLTSSELSSMTNGTVFSPYGALYLPDDHQVRNPPLVRGLAAAAKKLGATICEHTEVTGFIREQDRIIGVTTYSKQLFAEHIVIAGGAFSYALGQKLELDIPVFPVKGQAMLANGEMSSPYTVFSHGCYIVPKLTGQTYIGATEVPHQFDLSPSLGSISQILQRAIKYVPSVEQMSYAKSITGLRPGCIDLVPILGPVQQYKGLLLATGHFRNGVLLAPITGKLISDVIVKGTAELSLTPFLLDRFSKVMS